MKQLGLSLTENDVHAMMKSVGVGPRGKITFDGMIMHMYSAYLFSISGPGILSIFVNLGRDQFLWSCSKFVLNFLNSWSRTLHGQIMPF